MATKPILADFDLSGLEEVIKKANKRTANKEKKVFDRFTSSWSKTDKSGFVVEKVMDGLYDYQVYTVDPRFLWVDEGTKAHPISGSMIKPLFIRGGRVEGGSSYTPKTNVNKLSSVSNGGSYRDGGVYAYSVDHPGIEARNVTKLTAEKARKRWAESLQREIGIYIKGSMG